MDKNKKYRSLLVGIGLIIVGSVVLAERLNFYSDFIWIWLYRWEAAMILIGLLLVIIRKNFFLGFVSIAIGGFFIMDEFYFLPHNWEIWFLPIALIFGGIAFIFQPHSKECNK